jgi:hypothetical protein
MANRNRTVYARIEKLDSTETVLDIKDVEILDGKIDISGGSTRRKTSFTLAEPLSLDWQANRFKLYYGYQGADDAEIVYVPEGVYIPMNPKQTETTGGFTTNFQGVDKSKLLSDYQVDNPLYFPLNSTVRDAFMYVLNIVGITTANIDGDIGSLNVSYSFEEGTDLQKVLDTMLEGFNAEWYFDANGVAVARKRSGVQTRPVTLYFQDDDPIEITADIEVSEDNYYNSVTVVAGKADTDIYRASAVSPQAIARAGGRVVKKYFTTESALSLVGTQALANYYLSNGISLPFIVNMNTIVVPDLEVGDIIERRARRYQITSISLPLGMGTQTLKAGEVLYG